MTRGSRTHRRQCSPKRAGWWERLFAALLFAFYVNFIPIHLAAETHLDDAIASVADDALHHDDSDHHDPHRASDHTLTLTASAKAPSASVPAVFFLPAIAVLISEPEAQPPVPVFERIRPPGDSPPDPLQPRAPPLA